jgi:hemin uptake protein HemP
LILGVKKFYRVATGNPIVPDHPEEPRTVPAQSPSAEPLRTFDSVELFDGQKEVQIRHKGALYRLKITRQGKLILNK